MSLQSIKTYFSSEHRLMCLMLITLITSITLGLDTPLAKSLLITHFGLFLLWQPIYKQEASFSAANLVVFIIFMTAFITWINLWTTVFWVLLLSSLLNGRIFARGINRATYGLAVIILFLELTLVLTPSLFNFSGISGDVQSGINISLIILSLPLLFIPTKKIIQTNVDFIRGFMVVSLTLFLSMGSVIATLTTGQSYLYSLAITSLIAALFLFSASYLWAPRAGFSGIAQLWEKYLLNIGGPFEQWISNLAILEVNAKIEPDIFLQLAIKNLLERQWIKGVHWKTEYGEKTDGETSNFVINYNNSKLKLTLYSTTTIGPALMLHTKLLLTVLTFYYRAKLQERQLINQAHLRAVYETGSKLTHDVKNILQGTQALTQVVENDNTGTYDSYQLLQKQLPLLTQRLKSTLEKLSTPNKPVSEMGSLLSWWQQLKRQNANRLMNFTAENITDITINIDVFNSVIENLIENSRQKRSIETNIDININLICDGEYFELLTCDSGTPIPDATVKYLFKTILTSENGYGIGLYQSHQQANLAGYSLSLRDNVAGNVCFLLTNKIA